MVALVLQDVGKKGGLSQNELARGEAGNQQTEGRRGESSEVGNKESDVTMGKEIKDLTLEDIEELGQDAGLSAADIEHLKKISNSAPKHAGQHASHDGDKPRQQTSEPQRSFSVQDSETQLSSSEEPAHVVRDEEQAIGSSEMPSIKSEEDVKSRRQVKHDASSDESKSEVHRHHHSEGEQVKHPQQKHNPHQEQAKRFNREQVQQEEVWHQEGERQLSEEEETLPRASAAFHFALDGQSQTTPSTVSGSSSPDQLSREENMPPTERSQQGEGVTNARTDESDQSSSDTTTATDTSTVADPSTATDTPPATGSPTTADHPTASEPVETVPWPEDENPVSVSEEDLQKGMPMLYTVPSKHYPDIFLLPGLDL